MQHIKTHRHKKRHCILQRYTAEWRQKLLPFQ